MTDINNTVIFSYNPYEPEDCNNLLEYIITQDIQKLNHLIDKNGNNLLMYLLNCLNKIDSLVINPGQPTLLELISLILSRGIDVNITNKINNKSPIFMFSKYDYYLYLKLDVLIKFGADINKYINTNGKQQKIFSYIVKNLIYNKSLHMLGQFIQLLCKNNYNIFDKEDMLDSNDVSDSLSSSLMTILTDNYNLNLDWYDIIKKYEINYQDTIDLEEHYKKLGETIITFYYDYYGIDKCFKRVKKLVNSLGVDFKIEDNTVFIMEQNNDYSSDTYSDTNQYNYEHHNILN